MVEILIVVAVLAILAVVAYPSYQDYIIRSQLAEARGALADMRVRMEQYFQDNCTYVGADLVANGPCTAPGGLSNRFAYSCVLADLSATTYTLQAVGSGPMANFTFTIGRTAGNANDRRTTSVPTGWGTAPIACWVVRKGCQCQ